MTIGAFVVALSTVLATGAAAGPTAADLAIVRTSAASYHRSASKVMLRRVERPTRAHLDVAAYDRNIMLRQPSTDAPKPPAARPRLADLQFAGTFEPGTVKDALAGTPLRPGERAEPLAVEPLLDYLTTWDYDAAEQLLRAAMQIEAELWGNSDRALPLQRLAMVYLHDGGGVTELWGKVEFEPQVAFLDGVSDEDGDGYREIYGRVRATALNKALLDRIREDYLGRTLSSSEVRRYYNELVAKWYPTRRTVLLPRERTRPWPDPATEPEIVQELRGKRLERPTVVIRGQPFGEALYNVFLIDGVDLPAPGQASRPGLAEPAWGMLLFTAGGSTAMQANIARWRRELREWGGGSWTAWERKVAAFRNDVRAQLARRPAELKGLVGRDGYLFYRGSLDYVTAGDLRRQTGGRDPYPAIVDYRKQLAAKGIDLLVVILPSKPEIVPEKISAKAPSGGRPYVQPYTRKLLLELAGAGVEVVDLLPAFLAAKQRSGEPFYMTQDTHWSNTAVRLAAELIGDRVKKYPWYAQVCGSPKQYRVKRVSFRRNGDIVGMLRANERAAYRPMSLTAQQVLKPDGGFYQDDPNSPIVLLGDSFCGVFHYEDCEHAGISAHLARRIGMPVDLIMARGSGPRIRSRLSRRGATAVRAKKLVIWTVVARDLYNYWAPWDKVAVP